MPIVYSKDGKLIDLSKGIEGGWIVYAANGKPV
jgi:hypothetical protein